MTDTTKDKCDKVLEYEFRASEIIDELLQEEDQKEVEREMLTSIKELLGKVEDPNRRMTVYVLAYQIGRAMESETLLEFSEEKVQQFTQGR